MRGQPQAVWPHGLDIEDGKIVEMPQQHHYQLELSLFMEYQWQQSFAHRHNAHDHLHIIQSTWRTTVPRNQLES